MIIEKAEEKYQLLKDGQNFISSNLKKFLTRLQFMFEFIFNFSFYRKK